MAIKPLHAMNEETAAPEDVDDFMRAVRITKYVKSRTTKAGVHHQQYDHAVDVARKVIQIDDELIRRGFRPKEVNGQWVYLKGEARASLSVGAENVLSFTLVYPQPTL